MKIRSSSFFSKLSAWILIKFCYDICYVKYISIIFHYSGFNLTYSICRLVLSYLCLAIISTFAWIVVSEKQNTPAALISRILHLMYFIPATSMFAYGGIPSAFFACTVIYFFFLFILLACAQKMDIQLRLHVNNPEKKIKLISIFLFLVVFFVFAYYGKFKFQFDFINVYGRRLAAREYHIPSILSRILGLARNMLPLFVVYYWKKKNKIATIMTLFVIFCNFSIDGSKVVLFRNGV